MPQAFAAEYHRIDIDLPEILGLLLLERLACLRERDASEIGSIGVGREITPAVRRADLEVWESIERPFENQMGKSDGRFQRITDHIGQDSAALKPRAEFGNGLWMNKDRDGELFGLCPERFELWIREFVAIYTASDSSSPQPKLLNAFFQLLGSEIRMLQRN